LVKIRDTKSFWIGLWFCFPLVWLTFLGYLPDLWFIILFLWGIYLIFSNILKSNQAMLSISLGIIALIFVFIWLTTQNADLLSKDMIVSICGTLFFFIYGIIIHLGLLPEKYI